MIDKIIQYLRRRKRTKAIREFRGHLLHILHINDDILVESTKEKVREIIEEAEKINPDNTEEADKFIERAPLRVVKILPRQPFMTLREYADILAVAFTVAFGARALYLQPFKIPTSSMQPTLFGIHYIEDKNTLPHLPQPLHFMLYSTQNAELTVKRTGYLDNSSFSTDNKYIIFPYTRFTIGGIWYELPGEQIHIDRYCFPENIKSELREDEFRPREFKEGTQLCHGWLSLGDHLFVDRYTYHFREPKRGDIVVFNTEGLQCNASGYFYIKRLIGMPGDIIKMINNKVYVKEKGSNKFRPITDFGIAGINRIYSYKGGYHGHEPYCKNIFGNPATSQYSLEKVYDEIDKIEKPKEVYVPRDCYYMMGDNTSSSYDSRGWGFVPRRNIVGKALFIFWPFTRRWGIADHEDPLPVDSTTHESVVKAMQLQ